MALHAAYPPVQKAARIGAPCQRRANAYLHADARRCADGRHAVTAQEPIAIDSRFAEVNGIRLHYLSAGQGDPVLLLHGYAQTSHMWRPLIAELARTHRVIAPDLRGFGESAKPEGGYDNQAGGWLRQEDNGAGRPRPRGIARAPARPACGPRYRADGRLRLRCTAFQRSRRDCIDGRLSSRGGRLDERLAPQGPLAFSLLRRDAAGS
jgi:alpha/beta hydrolase fold